LRPWSGIIVQLGLLGGHISQPIQARTIICIAPCITLEVGALCRRKCWIEVIRIVEEVLKCIRLVIVKQWRPGRGVCGGICPCRRRNVIAIGSFTIVYRCSQSPDS